MQMDYVPLDPDWDAKVRGIFAAQGFMSMLGIELTEVRPGFVEMVVAHRPELTQQGGFFHGGLMGALVDNSGGCAAGTLMGPGLDVLAVEYKVNMLRPGAGERLRVVARVIKPGKTLCICRSDVFVLKGTDETLCAAGQGTYIYIPHRPAPAWATA